MIQRGNENARTIDGGFKRQRANEVDQTDRWKCGMKIGKLRFYMTWNWRLKTRNRRDSLHRLLKVTKHRKQVYARAGGRCEICGSQLAFGDFELHHVLPLTKFKQLAEDNRNMQCLCHKCHKEQHDNPYVNIRAQECKAAELGIDLKAYYGA